MAALEELLAELDRERFARVSRAELDDRIAEVCDAYLELHRLEQASRGETFAKSGRAVDLLIQALIEARDAWVAVPDYGRSIRWKMSGGPVGPGTLDRTDTLAPPPPENWIPPEYLGP